jgi:hypothetical protein
VSEAVVSVLATRVVHGDDILLNGTSIYLRGGCVHEDDVELDKATRKLGFAVAAELYARMTDEGADRTAVPR